MVIFCRFFLRLGCVDSLRISPDATWHIPVSLPTCHLCRWLELLPNLLLRCTCASRQLSRNCVWEQFLQQCQSTQDTAKEPESKDVAGNSLQIGPFIIPRINTGIKMSLFKMLVGPLEAKRIFKRPLVLHYLNLRAKGKFDQLTQRISRRVLVEYLVGRNIAFIRAFIAHTLHLFQRVCQVLTPRSHRT